MQNQLQNFRLKAVNKMRAERREDERNELRRSNFNKMFPIISHTLTKFHEILASDIYQHKDQIIQAIVIQKFQMLEEQDYKELLEDICYLVSHTDIVFPHIDFLRGCTFIVPQMLCMYYKSFHPQTIDTWFLEMSLDDRRLVYLSILAEQGLSYLKKNVVICAVDDLDCQDALQVVELCLSRGILIREILPRCVPRLIEIFRNSSILLIAHVKIVYSVSIRKPDQQSSESLKRSLSDNLQKVQISSQLQKSEFVTCLSKLGMLSKKGGY